jgi:sulfur relay (sulfurtransferase) complex TusBCD TusD component (DsrE family)
MSTFVSRLSPILVALTIAVAALMPASASAEEAKPGLFVNLTTDDTWAASKAIFFAHQKVLKNGHQPVVIWMNVRAVYLADKDRPSNIPGLMADSGSSIQDMLTAFMADGGKVIMCAACSSAAGLTMDDYIDGVEMGSWPVVEGYLFAEGMQTLSW